MEINNGKYIYLFLSFNLSLPPLLALVPFKNPSIAHLSWPLSEFTNPVSCLLMSSALEMMTFPVSIKILIHNLLNTLLTQ